MEHFCEIILKSNNWPMRRCSLKTFIFLALVFCSGEQNHFSNFDKGSPEKHFVKLY